MSAPLYDASAESLLIGALLAGADLADIPDGLQPSDFHRAAHGAAFNAINTVYTRGQTQTITPAAVAAELRRMSVTDLTEADLVLLGQQADIRAAWTDLETHANTIREHAQARQLERTLKSLLSATHDPTLSAQQKLDVAQQQIMSLGSTTPQQLADSPELAKVGWERIQHRINAPDSLIGLSTGYHDLDAAIGGLQGGKTYVVAGRTSMGKTWLALNLAANAALRHSKGVLAISLEMDRYEISERLYRLEARVDDDQIRRGFTEGLNKRLTRAHNAIEGGQLHVSDASTMPVATIAAHARHLHHRAPLGLIVVDYLQLIQTSKADGETRALEIGSASRAMKALARELDVPVVLLAQVSRGVEVRADKRPTLADLRESGSIEQDADCVMFIYRDEYYNPSSEQRGIAEINIAKQRNGRTGTIHLRYDEHTGRFDNLAREPVGVRA